MASGGLPDSLSFSFSDCSCPSSLLLFSPHHGWSCFAASTGVTRPKRQVIYTEIVSFKSFLSFANRADCCRCYRCRPSGVRHLSSVLCSNSRVQSLSLHADELQRVKSKACAVLTLLFLCSSDFQKPFMSNQTLSEGVCTRF